MPVVGQWLGPEWRKEFLPQIKEGWRQHILRELESGNAVYVRLLTAPANPYDPIDPAYTKPNVSDVA